jgi:hypothetical protein
MTSHVAHGVACLAMAGIAFVVAVSALRWVLSLSTAQTEPTNGKGR